MASPSGVSEQDLLATFSATLSPHAAERRAAEAHLAALQAQDPSCFVALTTLALNAAHPTPLRQAASIALRPLIQRKWSPFFDKFEGYADPRAGGGGGGVSQALPLEIKHGVRQGLLQALVCPERKIRLAASAALATVASPDFPDEFPELLPFLKSNLELGGAAAGSSASLDAAKLDAIHGSMIFLSDFVRAELDENQLMGVAREILPSMEAILVDEQVRLPTRLALRCTAS